MNTQRVEGHTPTPEGKLKISRCVRRECGECGEPATKYQGYLLPNARTNPASKGYRGDDISWCTDADAYFCDACHAKNGRTPPEGYTLGSTWTYGDRFMHMFFHYVEDKEASANIERLEKVNEALVRGLEYYIATAVQDTKWEEAVAALKLAKEPA